MLKTKTSYVCQQCSEQFPKWVGQCLSCQAWNSLVEEQGQLNKHFSRSQGYAPRVTSEVHALNQIPLEPLYRFSSGVSELDRVLGGGIIPGSVILMGGDPGIGKSTLLLQTLCQISQHFPCLYITGEESLQQVAMRAQRLDVKQDYLKVLTETQVEAILSHALIEKPRVLVIDSIQTISTDLLSSAAGSVGQLRESTALLTRFAKQSGTAVFLVGHVTKEGSLAGPRVLEHMVDTVLYFEGESHNRLRLIRAVKNRFGAVNELGVFAMTDKGLREVNNPSAIFLSRSVTSISGSIITATWEASRPLLVELQSLVDTSHLGNPRRVAVGLDPNRLGMLLAVLHRHAGIATYNQDVFVNVVGGMRLTEPSADLPVIFAVISSLRNKPLSSELIVFGEIGLGGEIRPVPSGQERIKEAAKQGFKQAIVPEANAPKGKIGDIDIIPVQHLRDALIYL